MSVRLRTCRVPRTCRHCKTTIAKGDRFYDHNSRPDEAVCNNCENTGPVGYLEWLAQRGYPSRQDVPLTRRCQLFDEWFRWRCAIGQPPDKTWDGQGGNPQERVQAEYRPVAPARIDRSHRPPAGWSAGAQRVG